MLLVATHSSCQHHLIKYGGSTLRIVLYTLTLNLPNIQHIKSGEITIFQQFLSLTFVSLSCLASSPPIYSRGRNTDLFARLA